MQKLRVSVSPGYILSSDMRARMSLRLVISAVVFLWMAGAPLLSQTTCQGPDKKLMWIIDSTRIAMIQAIDAELADHFFNNPCTYAFGSRLKPSIPAGWASIPAADFQSFADFQNAITNRTIDPSVKAILYDNESFSLTPPNEQVDPAYYTQQFADLAHAHGYVFISTPGTDLTTL